MGDSRRDDGRVSEIVAQKLDLKAQINDLRLQLAHLNKDLLKAGGHAAEIAAW